MLAPRVSPGSIAAELAGLKGVCFRSAIPIVWRCNYFNPLEQQ
jgi:hypothetical protein